MQKKAENAFQFENSCQKRAKMEKKKKHIYLEFFRFYIPCAFFCIITLKIHIKKDKNAKKKAKNFFQIAKINTQKKAKNNISKKDAKKAKMQKKRCKKKACGVYKNEISIMKTIPKMSVLVTYLVPSPPKIIATPAWTTAACESRASPKSPTTPQWSVPVLCIFTFLIQERGSKS